MNTHDTKRVTDILDMLEWLRTRIPESRHIRYLENMASDIRVYVVSYQGGKLPDPWEAQTRLRATSWQDVMHWIEAREAEGLHINGVAIE